jgi:alpha-D-ribose 1-methylphosphonate 5-triphosphate synthase subunit PhnI
LIGDVGRLPLKQIRETCRMPLPATRRYDALIAASSGHLLASASSTMRPHAARTWLVGAMKCLATPTIARASDRPSWSMSL